LRKKETSYLCQLGDRAFLCTANLGVSIVVCCVREREKERKVFCAQLNVLQK
jgi:hypothetical protein